MNIRRIIRLFVTCPFLCFFPVYSQSNIWSLEDCIRHATEHNISIQQLKIQKEVAEIDLNTSQMKRLPNLNATVEQRWNFGRTQIQSGLYENQTQSNTVFSIGSSIPLFTGFRISNEIARNRLELQAAVQNLEKAKENLALNVASLFLQVLFNKEILKIHEEQLALSQLQVERTQALVNEGKVPSSQLYDMEAQVANERVSFIQADNNLKLSLLDLTQSLELEQNLTFDIYTAEVIDDQINEYMNNTQSSASIFDKAVQDRPLIKEQEYKLESYKRMLKIAKSDYYPTLNLFMSFGLNYFYIYAKNAQNAPFSSQLKNNMGENIGLNLNIPIFNRLSTRNQVKNAKLNIENQQLIVNNTKKTLYKEIETAYLNALSAQEKYHASGLAVKATSESLQYAKERYETGKSSVFEFSEAKTRLVKSQSEE
ncbi:MAG: TolC family protein, partial [Bacteroidales bacterium]|nr:TolC family protein [Bacteroidales bacterium]